MSLTASISKTTREEAHAAPIILIRKTYMTIRLVSRTPSRLWYEGADRCRAEKCRALQPTAYPISTVGMTFQHIWKMQRIYRYTTRLI